MSVIVPIFNGSAFLPAFFDSLGAALPHGSEVILVNDGSTEPVFDAVPELPRASSVVRLDNAQNLGYSVAVNRGFAVASGDIVVQLNTDLVLDSRCISAMIELIECESRVGIVGSKLVFPTSGLVQHVGMSFGRHSKPHIYFEMPADHPLCNVTREVQICTGATVAMSRTVLNTIGPLEEDDYFNCNEDIDHCLRAKQARLRNFVCAESIAYHWESQSGPSRFAREGTSEAVFWSRWGSSFEMDLDRYVDEALDELLRVSPELQCSPFHVLNLSRGVDDSVVLDRLEARWPGVSGRVRNFRQMNNPRLTLELPMLLPHWIGDEPVPFLYLVDSYRELDQNAWWFQRRDAVVGNEVIVDLSGAAIRTAEAFE